MRLIGHTDQGGRSDGQQIMVRNGYAYIGHVCSRGFSVIDVRDPTQAEDGQLRREPAEHLEPAPARCTTTCCSSVHGRDMFAQPEHGRRAELLQAEGRPPRRPRERRRRGTGRPAWPSTTSPSRPSRGRSASCRSTAPAPPHLVRRRALGLRLGDDRRLLRLHPRHHRHAGPDEAADGRPILAAGHEPRRRREGRTGRCRPAATACTTRSSTTTSPIAPGATPASSSST